MLPEYMQITITILTIIGAIGAVFALVRKWLLPHLREEIHATLKGMWSRLDTLEDGFDDLKAKSIKDFETLQRAAMIDQAMMTALFALLEHAETTNGKGLIAKAKSKLVAEMIEKL